MSLTTFSVFYFYYEFNSDFQYIDFSEGGPDLQATVDFGEYTPTEMATAIEDALNNAGALTYTVTFNRQARTFTIAASGPFELLVNSGASSNKAFSKFGFTGADRTGAATYTGGPAGSEYLPQFILQDHVSTDNFQGLVSPSVNKSASGRVEVVRFGIEKFLRCNIKFATNMMIGGNDFRYNANGVEDLQEFMQYLTQKKPVEFMPDTANRSTFQTFILESTPEDKTGTDYLLKELYDKGLPNIFETGVLTFRLIED